jgi:hypothetical protein
VSLFVIDIDGTIADGRRRFIAAGAEPDREREPEAYERWKADVNAGIEYDVPVPGMVDFVRAVADQAIYMTARGSSLRAPTREWLKRHGFPDLLCIMRAEEDFRPSAKFKEWAIQQMLTSDYGAVVVLDDDQRGELEAVCKRRGWTFLSARSGGAV